MKHWALKYIGKPWRFGGRDIETGTDCWGLFLAVQRERFGIAIDDNINLKIMTHKSLVSSVRDSDEFTHWRETENPVEGDAVLLRIATQPHHVGIWIDAGDSKGVLHALENMGVVFTPSKSLELNRWKIHKFYRHKSHDLTR